MTLSLFQMCVYTNGTLENRINVFACPSSLMTHKLIDNKSEQNYQCATFTS